MNKPLILSTALVIGINTQIASAEHTEAKQIGTFFTSSIAGAAVGGPIGFVAGALGGAWLGEEIKKAETADTYQLELAGAADNINDLKSRLLEANDTSRKYAKMAMQPVELQLLFKTNQSELTPSGIERINQVAQYMINNPDVSIRLDGYADPRGTEQNNQRLSQARVNSIASELEKHGLNSQRITTHSHGASLSQAPAGDHDAYALERVVKIKVFRDLNKSNATHSFVAN